MSKSQRPRICILNSSSFGRHYPEHVAELEKFADVFRLDVHAGINSAELAENMGEVDGIISSVTPRIGGDFLRHQPRLCLIARHGIGCDNVDLSTATELGIPVTNVEGIVEKESVAELAVALAMAVARHLVDGAESVKAGRWAERSRFIGPEFRGKTVGIIGLGNIGSRVAEILDRGFACDVLAYDPLIREEDFSMRFARKCELEELLRRCDYVFLHCPLTEATHRMLNRRRLELMKKGAILVNTCRGELVDEDALVDCLMSGHLRGYGTDVVEGEPIDGNHRLLHIPGVVVLPHLGGYSLESLRGMGDAMVRDCMCVFVERAVPRRVFNSAVVGSPHFRRWR